MSRWDEPYSSTIFSLAKEFARRHRVFYIDHPYTIKDFWQANKQANAPHRRKALLFGNDIFTSLAHLSPNLIAVTPRLTLPINWANGGVYNFLARWNDGSVIAAIRKTIQQYNIKQYLFINSFDPFFAQQLPPDIAPTQYIYQSTDAMQQGAYVAKHGVKLEQEMMKRADKTLVTSKQLLKYAQQFSANAHLLPNAADVALFNQAVSQHFARPTDLPTTTQPIIMYTGNISQSRMDFALLQKIAQQHPNKQLVCIGPIDSPEHTKYGLDKMPNVTFLPPKTIEQLPAYLQYAQCCIIPFLANELTQSIYPLKINEYLAAGKPVVTTNFSEDIADFAHIAHVAQSHTDFVQAIQTALDTNTPALQQARIALAQTNSWTERAKQLERIVNGKW